MPGICSSSLGVVKASADEMVKMLGQIVNMDSHFELIFFGFSHIRTLWIVYIEPG
jgi:hypothetical protein